MKKNTLYFCGGFFVGSAVASLATYLITKKVLWAKCDEEINEMRDMYTGVSNTFDKKKYVPENVKKALINNWNKPELKATKRFEDELAESEHPVDSDEDEIETSEEELKADETSLDIEEERRENKGKAAEIISEEAIDELSPGWEERDFTYYQEDDTMVDENNQIIPDFRLFVGNILDDTGWIDDDEAEDIVIKSYEYMSVYRVTKILMAFGDTDYAKHQVMGDYDDLTGAYK